MNLSSKTFGNFKLYTVHTGFFKLDGGSMFGVVPKPLWTKKKPSDDQNRIPMVGRCLLVESLQTDRIYLIDNGCGTKFDEKYQKIYGIDQQEYNLESSLAYHGFGAVDITDLIFTHLHFDHCGGSTYYSEDDELRHTFPNARYHVTRSHWQTATNPNAREQASFFPENIEPLSESERLHLHENSHVFEEGFYTETVDGHSHGQQLPILTNGDHRLLFAADLFPTAAHLPLPWIMGFDMCARSTLEEKKTFLNRAVKDDWFLYLEHDHDTELITVEQKEGRFQAGWRGTLNDLSG